MLTTLLNPRLAPAHTLACAYHERCSLKPVGVIQELYGVLLAHYAVRVLMHEAALQADVDPDRLSFVHALEVVRDAVPEFQMVAPTQVDSLYARLLQDIAAGRLLERRLRANARVVKRKMSNFKLKRSEHYRPPKPLGSFRDAVVIQPSSDAPAAVLELLAQSLWLEPALLDLRQPEHCRI